jgi:hypothetical protein
MTMKGKKQRGSVPGPKPKFGVKMAFRVSVLLTQEQAKAIQEVAAASSQSASEWARDILLAALPKEIA